MHKKLVVGGIATAHPLIPTLHQCGMVCLFAQARGEEYNERPLPRVPPHPGGLHHLLHRPPHGDRVAAHHPVGGWQFPL